MGAKWWPMLRKFAPRAYRWRGLVMSRLVQLRKPCRGLIVKPLFHTQFYQVSDFIRLYENSASLGSGDTL